MSDFVSNAGKAAWVAAVQALGPSAPKYVGWGTGAGAGVGSGNLAAPVGTRETGIVSLVTTTTPNDTLRVTATLMALTHLTITEVGTFLSPTGLDLSSYFDFAGLDLKPGDSIQFVIDTQLV